LPKYSSLYRNDSNEKRDQMKFRVITLAAMLIFGSAIPSHASTTVDVSSGPLNFGADSGTNQANTIGALAGQGFSHRYNNVFTGVDAVLTVTAVNNIDYDDDESNGVDNLFDNVDRFNSTTGKAIDINIDIAGESPNDAQSGSASMRADFVQAGTNNPVTLSNISINVADIDSNQYVSFTGISAYELSSSPTTELTVSSSAGTYEFKEPNGNSSSASDQENWALVEYASASSISWIIGARESGSAFFSISFADATWDATPTRPTLALAAFDLTYNGNSPDSGSAPATQSSTSSSSTVTLNAPQGNLLKANSCFNGWNTRADGTGANYSNGDSIVLTSNTALFANWTCPTLSFNSNAADSGSVPSTQSATANSSSVTLVAAQGDLVKANGCFSGWNTRADGTGTNYLNGESITLTRSTLLYANWTCSVAPSQTSTPAPTPASVTKAVAAPTLANTGASDFKALLAVGLVGIGILLIAYVRRPVKS
jgi:hypothetical protein